MQRGKEKVVITDYDVLSDTTNMDWHVPTFSTSHFVDLQSRNSDKIHFMRTKNTFIM
jgi:hypothetical protein